MADENPKIWLTLRARDALGLIRFLVDAFGFEETVVYADGDTVHHAQLAWPPGGGLMLGSYREEATPWAQKPGTSAAYVVTDDPDGLCERAKAAGAEIVNGPVDQEYGSREFIARDPEGNLWSFGTYGGEPRKA